MCLEEYTQEYVDELHKIELERFKKRTDEAEAGREAEKLRADEAEIRADNEKSRADSLAELARSYGIPEEQIAAAEGR